MDYNYAITIKEATNEGFKSNIYTGEVEADTKVDASKKVIEYYIEQATLDNKLIEVVEVDIRVVGVTKNN